MRTLADSGKAHWKVMLAWKYDSMARNTFTAATFREMLRRRNIELISITEPNAEGAYAILINSVLDSIAEIYSICLAEDVIREQKENAWQSFISGRKPLYGLHMGVGQKAIARELKQRGISAPGGGE